MTCLDRLCVDLTFRFSGSVDNRVLLTYVGFLCRSMLPDAPKASTPKAKVRTVSSSFYALSLVVSSSTFLNVTCVYASLFFSIQKGKVAAMGVGLNFNPAMMMPGGAAAGSCISVTSQICRRIVHWFLCDA